ncbi:hypothetical protein [Bacillus sp. NEAU-Y102]
MTVDMLKIAEGGMEVAKGLQEKALSKFNESNNWKDNEEAGKQYGRLLAYGKVKDLYLLAMLDEMWKFLHTWEYHAKVRERDFSSRGDYKKAAEYTGKIEVYNELKEVLMKDGKAKATIKEIKSELGQNMYHLEDAYGNRFKKRGHEIKMIGAAVSQLPAGVSPVEAAIGREVLILK